MGRHWLILPDLFPHSVVYFYFQNSAVRPGRSWTIRDYSSGVMVEHDSRDFTYTHQEILDMATFKDRAPTRKVGHPDWISDTKKLNQQLCDRLVSKPTATVRRRAVPKATASTSGFPIVDEPALRRLRGGKALERMLTSRNSEDWVTWTFFRLLPHVDGWWASLVSMADVDLEPDDTPKVTMWKSAPSPPAYEAASRARMLASGNSKWVTRARDPKPVEGNTEVDLCLTGGGYLLHAEAKLHSDLSTRTTYDPTRDQLVRNIDVLLEQAGSRKPVMWMIVNDRRPDRDYMQRIEAYRLQPARLHRLLPHRAPEVLDDVMTDLRVICWSELLPLLRGHAPREVMMELRRRIT